ncbi:CbtA family protein [Pilimelia columellifera]|uniref:CbtA family protein n=1 Tax=Pilimelia columellifera subsp. columellifera TaxID=706583 RepID=A0ABN3NN60_9ACTN
MSVFRALLLRGLLAGLIAGLLAGAVGFVLGEPNIDLAIALEEQAAASVGGHDNEAPLVSRDGQRFGLFLAMALFGTVAGGLLAIAFALLRHKLGVRDDATAALGLTGAAFLGAVLVPFGKYPTNPPAVGDPSTVDERTVAYLLLVALGLLAVCGGVAAYRAASERMVAPLRIAVGVGVFLLTVGVAYAVLPPAAAAPDGFPANLLWDFRVSALAMHLTLWLALALAFATLTGRLGRQLTSANVERTQVSTLR